MAVQSWVSTTMDMSYHGKWCEHIWGPVFRKEVSMTRTSDYTPQVLWDIITCPCHLYLLTAHKYSYMLLFDVTFLIPNTYERNIWKSVYLSIQRINVIQIIKEYSNITFYSVNLQLGVSWPSNLHNGNLWTWEYFKMKQKLGYSATATYVFSKNMFVLYVGEIYFTVGVYCNIGVYIISKVVSFTSSKSNYMANGSHTFFKICFYNPNNRKHNCTPLMDCKL